MRAPLPSHKVVTPGVMTVFYNIFLIFLSSQLSGLGVLYGDIDGFRAIESPATTVPLDILVTSARPDIVFVHNDNTISIIELTIPFNTQESFNRAHILKTKKFDVLVSDLEHSGLLYKLSGS